MKRIGLNRVAVGEVCRTMTQGSSCLPPSLRYGAARATLGFWDGIPLGFLDGASTALAKSFHQILMYGQRLHAKQTRTQFAINLWS